VFKFFYLSSAFVLLVGPAGCGTVQNLTQVRVVYGGVAYDLVVSKCLLSDKPLLGDAPIHRDWQDRAMVATMVVGGLVFDLPFCAAADTLTLPITLPSTVAAALEKLKPKKQDTAAAN
jgi:uncharacterized protein YceK